ncbi:TPA: winged helix-turn-helix transcriptional regulator, partial [Candidatus Micrarchaeota archaeon]|nr:winged helix-turn-helix transcriptional regulator [Candidatus Micrarchaeota archaeon]
MDGIALDRNTLRALGADTRVKMLKLLGERRKMQAELAVELGLKPPSVREHLERLAEAGLVRRIESERKWKYYELTEKGSA